MMIIFLALISITDGAAVKTLEETIIAVTGAKPLAVRETPLILKTVPMEVQTLKELRILCAPAFWYPSWCDGSKFSTCPGNEITDPCDPERPWMGIYCQTHLTGTRYYVEKIILNGSGLSCDLQKVAWFEFMWLEHVDFRKNKLFGPFPFQIIYSLPTVYVDLSYNQLTGSMPIYDKSFTMQYLSWHNNTIETSARTASMACQFKAEYATDLLQDPYPDLGSPQRLICNCPPNSIFLDLVCVRCPPGSEAVGTNQLGRNTHCQYCAIGTANWGLKDGFCEMCPLGTYTDVAGSRRCKVCPPGQYTHDQKGCYPCPIGTYNDKFGMSECSKCPSGTMPSSKKVGAVMCIGCPPGSFGTGDGKCYRCPIGSHAESANTTRCSNCPIHTYNDIPGNFECEPCPPGHEQHYAGQWVCDKCLPGTYQNATGKACISCPMGSVAPLSGSSSCEMCPAGTVSKNSTTLCTTCPRNTYSYHEGSINCALCPTNSFSVEGQSRCFKASDPGREYNVVSGRMNNYQTRCESGFYNDGSDIRCTECSAGSYASENGQMACEMCPAGSFSKLGQKECTLARPGRHVPDFGEAQFQLCPIGFYANESGQSECSVCPKDSFTSFPGSSTCIQNKVGEMLHVVYGLNITLQWLYGNIPIVRTVEERRIVEAAVSYSVSELGYIFVPTPSPPFEFPEESLTIPLQFPFNANRTTMSEMLKILRSQPFQGNLIENTVRMALERGMTGFREWNIALWNMTISNILYSTTIATPCIPGNYLFEGKCKPCSPGYYSPEFGMDTCLLCPKHHIARKFGQYECNVTCPRNQYTPKDQRTRCEDCPYLVFDISDTQCKWSHFITFILPVLFFGVLFLLKCRAFWVKRKKRIEEKFAIRCELLIILRSNGKSINQTEQSPMGTISPATITKNLRKKKQKKVPQVEVILDTPDSNTKKFLRHRSSSRLE